jgi:hypothetical protein
MISCDELNSQEHTKAQNGVKYLRKMSRKYSNTIARFGDGTGKKRETHSKAKPKSRS